MEMRKCDFCGWTLPADKVDEGGPSLDSLSDPRQCHDEEACEARSYKTPPELA